MRLSPQRRASEDARRRPCGWPVRAAGAPDLLLWHAGKSYALELKADAGGRVSESQADMLDRLGKAGVLTAVATGIDSALATLEGWHLLRGSVQ